MAKRTITAENDQVSVAYMNWLQQLVLMVGPKNAAIIAARAMGKTTGILAPRIQDVSYDMPGCYMAISGDTFMNLRKNVVPSLMDGWKIHGWHEDHHYVVNKRPPKTFGKPYKAPIEYKHSITDFLGTHYKMISQDRPSGGAGDSYQHIVGDEVKYQSKKKISKLTPAKRGGELKFRKSVYYGGVTFTTDMPNVNHGEHDWILDMEKNMDKAQIKRIIYAAFILNEIRAEVFHAEQEGNRSKIEKAKRKFKRWEDRWISQRKNSTFFYIASSLVNLDFLGFEYLLEQFDELDFSELCSAIFSIQPKMEKSKMFYPALSENLFNKDGWDYSKLDNDTDWTQEYQESSLDLKYIDHRAPIEAGMDTGGMCSLVTGQEQGNKIRALKEFYTVGTDFLIELGKQFRDFYRHHKEKHLELWPDRAAFAYKKQGEDHASKFKKAIEYDEFGNSTGWTVTIMNENQETIYHWQEYELALAFMTRSNPDLPELLIDGNTCKCLKSSMELAEKIIKTSKTGSKTVHKNKSSEKLPEKDLPMKSTNMSDAFKYFMCRPKFLEKIGGNTVRFTGMPGAH
ncbi:hypothetical protein JM79_3237 [Gramella sp. Hel_I_59]|uniref:hypothetical protein n=1 Tax=Gramella sp. Hel_I_59 TaxID=1249978 RepID=UPI00114F4B0E|nr:hypothetical protein [Gramella sp. Hel_I_59]TQI72279.1 hypothetical protein JM79_3237 [Gramella sp. Hel_I_59]